MIISWTGVRTIHLVAQLITVMIPVNLAVGGNPKIKSIV